MEVEIKTPHYWSAVVSKLVETFISVKLWIIGISVYFVFELLSVYNDIKLEIFKLLPTLDISNPNSVQLIQSLTKWCSSILDISFAMFTGVIIVITLSREIFKHAKISNSYSFNTEDKIKNNIV